MGFGLNKGKKHTALRSDCSAQMIVLEVIFFAAMVLLSIVFLYQLSPMSFTSEVASNPLQQNGDDALRSLSQLPHGYTAPLNYPENTLEHYLITNSYGSLINDIQNNLPLQASFNIYISNQTTTYFWCNSNGEYTAPLSSFNPVANCHCYVSLDPIFSTVAHEHGWYGHINTTNPRYAAPQNDKSDVFNLFGEDTSSRSFLITLELWRS